VKEVSLNRCWFTESAKSEAG